MACQHYVEFIETLDERYEIANLEGELRRAITFVDCCCQMGRKDLARKLLKKIEATSLSKRSPIAELISEQKWKLKQKGNAGTLILGWNFASAMIRWAGSGFQTRTEKEIKKRLAVCQACPEFENNACKKCGCYCNEKEQLLNKLALASEKCPIGKWE